MADKQYKLADWAEENIEEYLTVIDCPPEVQRRLRTSNIMESINRQLKRRTNVISIFPSEASLLRIVTAKLWISLMNGRVLVVSLTFPRRSFNSRLRRCRQPRLSLNIPLLNLNRKRTLHQ